MFLKKDPKEDFIDIWKYILAHHPMIPIIQLPALGHILIIDLPHTIQANQIYIGLNTLVQEWIQHIVQKIVHESNLRYH